MRSDRAEASQVECTCSVCPLADFKLNTPVMVVQVGVLQVGFAALALCRRWALYVATRGNAPAIHRTGKRAAAATTATSLASYRKTRVAVQQNWAGMQGLKSAAQAFADWKKSHADPAAQAAKADVELLEKIHQHLSLPDSAADTGSVPGYVHVALPPPAVPWDRSCTLCQ